MQIHRLYLHFIPKDLLQRILVPDPRQRITIQQIITHPWFTLQGTASQQAAAAAAAAAGSTGTGAADSGKKSHGALADETKAIAQHGETKSDVPAVEAKD